MTENDRPTAIRPSPTPSELRKMPAHERDAIMAAQFAEAEHEYRTNRALTDFEAFGVEDGPHDHDDESSTESR